MKSISDEVQSDDLNTHCKRFPEGFLIFYLE